MAGLEEALAKIAEVTQRGQSAAGSYRTPRTRDVVEGGVTNAVLPDVGEGLRPTGKGGLPQQAALDETAEIAVLVALPTPELEQVLRTFAESWHKESQDGVIFNVANTRLGGETRRILAAVQNDMGMVSAAILATKTAREWRPRLVAMSGVCAATKGRGINLGDIIVGL